MASKNSTWIVLAIVVMVFAVGFYYYDADVTTSELEQTEEIHAGVPADQAQRPQTANRQKGAKTQHFQK